MRLTMQKDWTRREGLERGVRAVITLKRRGSVGVADAPPDGSPAQESSVDVDAVAPLGDDVPATDRTADVDEGEQKLPATETRRTAWRRILVYGVLPGLALILAMAGGYFKWQYSSVHDSQTAAAESL
jgi:Mce-associated membrane protein